MILISPRRGPNTGRKSNRAHPLSNEKWETHRPVIMRLYITEGKPLHHVRHIMERDHGFIATTKQYKSRFQQWNVKKYLNKKVASDLVQRMNDGLLQDSSDLLSTTVSRRRVDRYLKRSIQSLPRQSAPVPTGNGLGEESTTLDPGSRATPLPDEERLRLLRKIGYKIVGAACKIESQSENVGIFSRKTNPKIGAICSLIHSLHYKLGLYKEHLLKDDESTLFFRSMNRSLAIIEPLIGDDLRLSILYALNYAQSFYQSRLCGFEISVLQAFDYLVEGQLHTLSPLTMGGFENMQSRGYTPSFVSDLETLMSGFREVCQTTVEAVLHRAGLVSPPADEVLPLGYNLLAPETDLSSRPTTGVRECGTPPILQLGDGVNPPISPSPLSSTLDQGERPEGKTTVGSKLDWIKTWGTALGYIRKGMLDEAKKLLHELADFGGEKGDAEEVLSRCARYRMSLILKNKKDQLGADAYLRDSVKSSLYFDGFDLVSWQEVKFLFA